MSAASGILFFLRQGGEEEKKAEQYSVGLRSFRSSDERTSSPTSLALHLGVP